MNNSKTLVSVITPTFRRYKDLKKNLNYFKKIYHQYKNFEWIVVSENHDFKTHDLILKKKLFFIKFFKGNFGHVNKAFNFGLKKAKGKYVIFHGDDDFFYYDTFKIFSQESKSNDDWYIGYGSYVNEKNIAIRKITTFIKKIILNFYSIHILSLINFIMAPSVFIKRTFLMKTKGLKVDVMYASDYDLWLKLSKLSHPVIIKHFLSKASFHKNTMTGSFSFSRYLEQYCFVQKNISSLFLIPIALIVTLYLAFYNFFKKNFK